MTRRSKNTPVARVVGLWRYPVKSMGSETLRQAEVSWDGLAGDRRWAFVKDNAATNGFPWLTLRDCPTMSHYIPTFTGNKNPQTATTLVRTPSGVSLEITDAALGRELYPAGVRVIRQSRGIFDTFPLSLISTQTIRELGEMVGEILDVRRFRPNILVEAIGDHTFPEDTWVGKTLRLGNARMRIDKRDGRCVVITIDPETAQHNPTVLRTVAQQRDGCLGVYGTTVTPGEIAINDWVYVDV